MPAENPSSPTTSQPLTTPPTLFVSSDPRRGRIIAAANATARKAGILPSMTVTQARSFLSAFPSENIQWIEHDPHVNIEDLYTLAERLMEFSPLVGVEAIEAHPWCGRSLPEPQAILMDITGLANWYGDETTLAMTLQLWLTRHGYFGCIGIGNTLGQAWALANYTARREVPEWMLQVERAEHSLLDTLDIDPRIKIFPAENPFPSAFFGTYPVEALRITIDIAAKLHRLGIRTIHALEQLPRSSLTSRFGPLLLQRLDQTLANRSEPISIRHAGEPIDISVDLEHPIFELQHLEQLLESTVRQLCRRLEENDHGIWRLLVRIAIETTTMQSETHHHNSPRAHLIQLGMFQASRDPEHLLWLLSGCLERNPPRLNRQLGIRQVTVQAAWTAPMRWQQHELFECESLKYRNEAAKLIDGLAARLGRDRVLCPSTLPNPIPELQTKLRPLTGIRTDGSNQSTERKLRKAPIHNFRNTNAIVPNSDAAWTRPTQLLEKPIEIKVSTDATHSINQLGIPSNTTATTTHPVLQGKIKVLNAYGPERIESQWWSGPTIRRNYYRVSLESGQWWWIFEDMNTHQWYLHGFFD